MNKKTKNTLRVKQTSKSDFSNFFYNASAKEKEKLFREVIHKANEDQRALVERYEQAQKTA